MDARSLAVQMGDLARDLAAQPDLGSTLQLACDLSREPVGAGGAGIFVMTRGEVQVAAVSGPGMVAAELVQLELGEGPCLSAITEHEPITVRDMTNEERWPAWAAYMSSRGWRSALAVRLVDAAQHTLGSLNLFATEPDAFDVDDVEVAEIFGQVISAALIGARTREQLQEAITARHSVGVAQGILMHRYQLADVEASFEVLRRYSQDHNVKLSRVAAWVIAHRELPPTPVDGTFQPH